MLYIVHFTAFCLGGPFFSGHDVQRLCESLIIIASVTCRRRIEFEVKKERFYSTGGTRVLKFVTSTGDVPQFRASGKTLTVSIGPGLAKNTSEYLIPLTP